MEIVMVGLAIITTVVVADLVFRAKKKEKPVVAIDKPQEKNKQAMELLKELRMKAYL